MLSYLLKIAALLLHRNQSTPLKRPALTLALGLLTVLSMAADLTRAASQQCAPGAGASQASQTSSSQRTPPPQNQPGEGNNQLSTQQVANLPLNQRDFTKLLALAGGTTTDTNGANNFTLQFAINGQRGVTAVFAMDGIYTTDPELGGATFSNFNVNAIQDIQSQSGVMPPDIGEGAAGYTNVITKSGTNQVHGDAFEFLRNSALDARNFFDRRSFANPGRIPPFQRNEFGFDLGGPMKLPVSTTATEAPISSANTKGSGRC